MQAGPVVTAANLILVPAEKLKTKQAAIDALRPLCVVPGPQHDLSSEGPVFITAEKGEVATARLRFFMYPIGASGKG